MIDLNRLAAQGRAYSPARAWTEEELASLMDIVQQRGVPRLLAADYVRNGIMSLEDFDKASKNNFQPIKLEAAHKEAEEKLKDNGITKKRGKTK